jgi:hypothetical protein
VGSDTENPVILNLNDAKDRGVCRGYWDVEIVEKATYDIVFHFYEPIKTSGRMHLLMGTLHRTLVNEQGMMGIPFKDNIIMPGIQLEKGQYQLKCWYSSQNENTLPFYVEVLRK